MNTEINTTAAHICPVCHKEFGSAAGLRGHMNKTGHKVPVDAPAEPTTPKVDIDVFIDDAIKEVTAIERKPKAERKKREPKTQNPCLCGCGQPTKKSFAMGHDAKVKSAILKNIKSNLPWTSGISSAAVTYAEAHWVTPICDWIKKFVKSDS